jgi:peptide deformylase
VAELPVLIYGDQKLRKKSLPVQPEDFTPEFQAFLDDMIETMYVADGIGLAAAQVGVLKRLFVMDVSWVEKEVKEPMVFINPVIEPVGEPSDFDEGCLSLPDIRGKVIRPSAVRITWLDREGNPQEMVAEGLFARCAQHELDHLEGILFVDRLSATGKALAQGKLKRLAKQGK